MRKSKAKYHVATFFCETTMAYRLKMVCKCEYDKWSKGKLFFGKNLWSKTQSWNWWGQLLRESVTNVFYLLENGEAVLWLTEVSSLWKTGSQGNIFLEKEEYADKWPTGWVSSEQWNNCKQRHCSCIYWTCIVIWYKGIWVRLPLCRWKSTAMKYMKGAFQILTKEGC